jgi:hypothetical protein
MYIYQFFKKNVTHMPLEGTHLSICGTQLQLTNISDLMVYMQEPQIPFKNEPAK